MEQWGGETLNLDRNLGRGLDLEREVTRSSGGCWGEGVGGSLGVIPWMKMRSVFGTCMVSGIRRREKVREQDREHPEEGCSD